MYICTYIFIYNTPMYVGLTRRETSEPNPSVVGCKIPRKENSSIFRFFCGPFFLFPRVNPRLTRRWIKAGAPDKNNRVDCNF